uniref:Hsp70 nucleotide exchange factor FES1 n=1 Tax=Noccaea caerulescens TaxID=107243 RepID=A0A1J3K956_NOCCA
MAKDGPNWDGLLKWSLSHADGTRQPRQLSEEDRKWFMEAMQSQTVDVVKRMKEITLVMQTPEQVLVDHGVTSEDLEDLLDELQEHVESIDMANDLHSIGGLVPLLGFLKNSHANIRAKAADVVSTIVQNNPRSQELVMEANGLESLLSNFTSDTDVHARTQALGAISSLIRNNKPGVTAFKLAQGYAGLKAALATDSVRFRRKALNLLHYLLQEYDSECSIAVALGFPRVMMHHASSEDAETREAALRGLVEFTKGKHFGSERGTIEKDDEKLRQLLEERIKGISSMSQEDLETVKEERQLVDSLWSFCYNEPSPLREKGLLVLPGEDALPPDVASKLFEPPLRAAAANRNATEKKEEPLKLLGP